MVDPLMTPTQWTSDPKKSSGGPMDPPGELPPEPSDSYDSIMYPIADRWGSHPGVGITPRRVNAIYRAAEWGYPQEQCDLFEDGRESDGHLRSQCEARIQAVAGKDWNVQAGGDRGPDHTAANEFQDALLECGNMDEMLEHQLCAVLDGYMPSRTRWKYIDGTWVPTWFDNVPARRVRFDLIGYPRLLTFDNPAYGDPFLPGEWIMSRGRHRVTAMSGLMRTLMWWAMFKRFSVRDWVLFCEKFGLPYPYGVYPDDLPEEEKAALLMSLQKIGRGGFSIFNDRAKIEQFKVEGGTMQSPQASLAGFCNSEMSKLLTGATLTSGEGSSTGSYALGRVHEDKMFTLTLADARRLERVIQQQLGAQFVHFNGMKCAPPKIKLHVVRDQDPQARMDVISRAANELGMDVDEDQIRLEFQIKKPTGASLKGTLVAKRIEPPQKTPVQTVD